VTLPAVNHEYYQLQGRLREGRMHRVRIAYRRIELFFQRHPWLELTGQVLLLCAILGWVLLFAAALDPRWSAR
jgi:hypothetical protein